MRFEEIENTATRKGPNQKPTCTINFKQALKKNFVIILIFVPISHLMKVSNGKIINVIDVLLFNSFITAHQPSCGKVIFSHVPVC